MAVLQVLERFAVLVSVRVFSSVLIVSTIEFAVHSVAIPIIIIEWSSVIDIAVTGRGNYSCCGILCIYIHVSHRISVSSWG